MYAISGLLNTMETDYNEAECMFEKGSLLNNNFLTFFIKIFRWRLNVRTIFRMVHNNENNFQFLE